VGKKHDIVRRRDAQDFDGSTNSHLIVSRVH
jgi:hypothetical protein